MGDEQIKGKRDRERHGKIDMSSQLLGCAHTFKNQAKHKFYPSVYLYMMIIIIMSILLFNAMIKIAMGEGQSKRQTGSHSVPRILYIYLYHVLIIYFVHFRLHRWLVRFNWFDCSAVCSFDPPTNQNQSHLPSWHHHHRHRIGIIIRIFITMHCST